MLQKKTRERIILISNQKNIILTSIQTSRKISAANGRLGIIRLKTPRIEQKIQLTIIATIIIYSIIFF